MSSKGSRFAGAWGATNHSVIVEQDININPDISANAAPRIGATHKTIVPDVV